MTTHLGTLHGEGTLLGQEGRRLGQVIYEIDGYVDHGTKSANGQIEADTRILDEGFRAEHASIVLNNGRCIQGDVSDPRRSLEMRCCSMPLLPASSISSSSQKLRTHKARPQLRAKCDSSRSARTRS